MTTQIMGILNLTEDSNFDGGKYNSLDKALTHAEYMIGEGAEWIDIGAESTRPGSKGVSLDHELKQVIPVGKALVREFGKSIKLSCDTSKPEVAEEALNIGFSMINDVTGFTNPKMVDVVGAGISCCIMHMQGSPETMQDNPSYGDGVVAEVHKFLLTQAKKLIDKGVAKDSIYLDPGIGFGKSVEDNILLINSIPDLQESGYPLLLGTSRKSFIQKITGRQVSHALPGTLAVNSKLVEWNVDILRVHDVPEHRDLITINQALKELKISHKA